MDHGWFEERSAKETREKNKRSKKEQLEIGQFLSCGVFRFSAFHSIGAGVGQGTSVGSLGP